MKATILDLRRRTRAILKALDHNEPVTLTCRGKAKGTIYPVGHTAGTMKVAEHPAFGMWQDRPEYKDVNRAVRRIRKGRTDVF